MMATVTTLDDSRARRAARRGPVRWRRDTVQQRLALDLMRTAVAELGVVDPADLEGLQLTVTPSYVGGVFTVTATVAAP